MELTGPRHTAPGEDAPRWPADGAPTGTGGGPAGGPGPSPPAWGQDGASYWWPEEGSPGARQGWPVPTGARPATRTRPPAGARSRAGSGPGPRGRARRAWQRLVSALVAVGAFIAKFGALMLKVKYLGLVLSMLLSVVAYSLFFGWTFAVGFVLIMLVHEMGHVIELRRQGVRASLPMFVPFLGAFVNMREMPRSAFHEALSGLAGPYFGTAASAVVAFWGQATGSRFLLQLAAVGFMLNLFNLLPMLPLDGGRAAAALHPVLWLAGLIGLLVFTLYAPSPIILLVIVFGGFELWRRWTSRNSPAAIAYNTLRPVQRAGIAFLYLLVIAVALVGFQLTYVARSLHI